MRLVSDFPVLLLDNSSQEMALTMTRNREPPHIVRGTQGTKVNLRGMASIKSQVEHFRRIIFDARCKRELQSRRSRINATYLQMRQVYMFTQRVRIQTLPSFPTGFALNLRR